MPAAAQPSQVSVPAPARDFSSCLELVLDVNCDIGESPMWDSESSTLTFIDQTPGRVFRFDPHGGSLSSFDVGQEIGAAVPRLGGGFVLTSSNGLLQVRGDDGPANPMLAIDADDTDTRLNDAKCDLKGRLWTGTLSKTSRRKVCSLYCIDTDLSVKTALQEVGISNGIAWSPQGTCMYYADTVTRGIDAFDYDLTTGRLTNRRRFVAIDRSAGVPDGITVDSEGHVWVALYLGGAVRRYAPDGTWVGTINLPVKGATSCCFGGHELRDLYITTAAHLSTQDEQAHRRLAGSLFRCRVEVRGLQEPKFPR